MSAPTKRQLVRAFAALYDELEGNVRYESRAFGASWLVKVGSEDYEALAVESTAPEARTAAALVIRRHAERRRDAVTKCLALLGKPGAP